jgi:acryloyl-coenzyme A reductase
MKAVLVRTPGAVDVLEYTTVPDPSPASNEVVLKVYRCGVCFHDLVTRNGTLKAGVKLPCVLGHEVAGEVVAVGSQVDSYRLGDRVATTQRSYICGHCRFCRAGHESLCPTRIFMGDHGYNGGYAEFLAVSAHCITPIPDNVSYDSAAIASCAIGTGLNAIRDVGKVQMGETVLVTGAGGGLGVHAIQLARLAGATVIAQTTSADKVDTLKALGADAVVVHARGEDFSAQVRDLTQGEGVNVIVDNVGTPLFSPMRKSLAIQGRWLLIGQLTGDFVPFNPAQLFLKNQSMLSVTSTSKYQLNDVLRLLSLNKITACIDRTYRLEEAGLAHQRLEQGGAIGRQILTPT